MTEQPSRQSYVPIKGPRTHQNCIAQTGKARPGKTAVDKARGVARRKVRKEKVK